jgi:hypothetical protein
MHRFSRVVNIEAVPTHGQPRARLCPLSLSSENVTLARSGGARDCGARSRCARDAPASGARRGAARRASAARNAKTSGFVRYPIAAPRRCAGLTGTRASGHGALAATGPQDEGGARSGLGGEHVGVVEHEEAAVEEFPELDPQASPAPAARHCDSLGMEIGPGLAGGLSACDLARKLSALADSSASQFGCHMAVRAFLASFIPDRSHLGRRLVLPELQSGYTS